MEQQKNTANKKNPTNNNSAQKQQQQDEKQYKCRVEGCDKAYARYPSLYTHIKLKHPKHPLQALIPTKTNTKPGEELKQGSKPINIKQDTINLLCNANFLLFFKEIKELPVFDENIKDYFLSEQSAFTKLNSDLLDQGNPSQLKLLNMIIQDPESVDASDLIDNSLVSVSGFLQQSQVSIESKKTLFTQSSAHPFVPTHYTGFFVIARELVKPLNHKFALEICYLFNRIIFISEKLKGRTVKNFVDAVYREILRLIAENKQDFPRLSDLSENFCKEFCMKFANNLSQLFQIE